MVQIETRRVIAFYDFLEGIGAEQEVIMSIMKDLEASDVSYGANPDTLLDANTVEELITPYGFKVPEEFDNPENPVWFSLGC